LKNYQLSFVTKGNSLFRAKSRIAIRDKEKKRENPRPRPVSEHRFFKETLAFFFW